MVDGDGNGWVECGCGRRHWGRHGAAGLALIRVSPRSQILLQLRAAWTHEGGTWGLVGGARDSHESVTEAALREAREEAAVDTGLITVTRTLMGTDHGAWSYTYVIGFADRALTVAETMPESDALAWVDLEEVPDRPLHPSFARSWPLLRAAIDEELTLRPGRRL